jgi:ABC-type amino acid transport system permease subunit
MRTDRQDMTKLIVALLSFAKEPVKSKLSIILQNFNYAPQICEIFTEGIKAINIKQVLPASLQHTCISTSSL